MSGKIPDHVVLELNTRWRLDTALIEAFFFKEVKQVLIELKIKTDTAHSFITTVMFIRKFRFQVQR